MKRPLSRCVLLVLMALAVSSQSYAQTNPNLETGFKPYGSYSGSDVDSVSLTNGNLIVHIPLFSYPQRGPLSGNSVIFANNKIWRVFQNCNHLTGVCTDKWLPVVSYTLGASITGTGGFSASWTYNTTYTWIYTLKSWDQSTHQMAKNLSDGSYESIDNTGFRNDGSRSPNTYGTTWNRAGNQTSQDSNGNVSTSTDTLGRTIASGQTSTSDYSGCGGSQPIVSATITNYLGPNGGNTQLKVCLASISLQTNFQANNVDMLDAYLTEYSGAKNFVQSVVVYNGSSWTASPAWTFEYVDRDPGDSSSINYGSLTKITFPTGGSISYAYSRWALCNGDNIVVPVSRGVISRTVNANDGSGPHITTYNGSTVVNGSLVPVETDPAGNETLHTITGLGGSCSYYETQTQFYQGTHASGTLLKTVQTDYMYQPNNLDVVGDGTTTVINVLPTRVTTTWPNNKITKVEKDYDSQLSLVFNGFFTESFGNVTEMREYDYGTGVPGALLRKTDYTYLAFTNSSYRTANMIDRVASVTVYNGSGTQVSQTTYGYDEGTLSASGVTTNHVSLPTGTLRGNQTSVHRWLNTTGGTLNTTTAFYDTGMPYQVTDPGGHVTTLAYSSANAGAYVTQTTMPTTNSPNNSAHVISGTYDFNTGLLASFTDQNSQTTNYNYDPLWRISSANFPGGGQTTFNYPDLLTIERVQLMATGISTDGFFHFDGLGREIRRISANDETTPWDQVDTCYDVRGSVRFKSYPYQGTGLSSAQICSGNGDSFVYDAIGRVTTVTHSDASTVVTSYTGGATSVSDEGNGTQRVQRISQADGLGRLLSICEVTGTTLLGITPTPSSCGQDIGATGFLTAYGYDALGNLTSVTQGGLNARSFQYDSLSRLTSSTNPEAGTITYGYNADSLLTTRTAPKPNQTSPSVTVTTTMTYDEIHRLRTKTYNDGSTPFATINYDETSALGVSGLLYTTGRPSSSFVTNTQGQKLAGEVFGYDQRGRVKNNSQCTPQNCGTGIFSLNYTYDLIGDVLTSTNGMGVTLTQAYNRAARLTSLTSSLSDANHPASLLSSVHYNAFAGQTSASLGNGLNESLSYFTRGWLQTLNVGPSGGTYSVSLTYTPNGNVLTGNDSVNGNWTYTYDAFNRLVTSNKNSNQQAFSYDYDRFGNRWHQNITAGSGPTSSLGFDANNHITSGSSVSYDAAGNVTADGTHTYTLDAENRLIQVDNGTTASYVYNANGERVRKTTGAVGVDYLYNLAGQVISEVSSSGGWNRGEVFAGGKHLATYSGGTGGTTYFIHADWLGTERARTTATGAPYETCTGLPFGDGFSCSSTDVSPLHFTGKQRDTESGLDYFGARYLSSNMGRFTSVDPKATSERPVDPQSWNRYAYTRNNPVIYTDPDGQDFQKVFQDLKAAVSQVTVKVSVGVGFGGKAKLGPVRGRAEVAVKANLKFSNGKLSVSESAEAAVSLGKGKTEVGVGGSVDQVKASYDLNTGKTGGAEPATVEKAGSGSQGGPSGTGSKEEFGVESEKGDGLLGGGGISITNEGLNDLRDALKDLKEILLPPPPPPPPPPKPSEPAKSP